MSTLDAALDYAQRGWRVIPILAGSKRPALTRWTEHATTDTATIKDWWDGHDDYGVGIATGADTGFWVLDVDDYESFRDLEQRYEVLPTTRTTITGSGGYHFLFAWPTDGRDIRNDAGKRLGPGLDVRGEGGQIVAPPSVHPNGTAYQWDAGQGDDIATAPDWLLDLVCVTDVPAQERPHATPTGDRPGDLWAAATTWGDLLIRDGWQLHHVDRSGEHHWTRPGKTTREGTSATTGYQGADVLKVFTSSLRSIGLDEEETYSKLGYLAATRFNGDHSAAASALAAAGWTEPTDDPFDTPEFHASVAALAERTLTDLPDVVESTDDTEHWEFVDVSPILDGTHNPPVPTLMARTDGVGLIYPGRVHSLAGEPGGGKTWIALHLIADRLNAGEAAMLIDYEDSPLSAVSRLQALGVTDDAIRTRFVYVRPLGPLIDRQGRVAANTIKRIDAVRPDVVVIDSIGESLAAEGLRPNDDDDVTRWFRLIPRRFTRHGAAVLGVDHQAKDREGRGLWAIGSQRKLAAIDGAAYVAAVKVAPTKTRDGHLTITCAKDRHGTHQRGNIVASAHVLNACGGVRIRLEAPTDQFRPTTLMERVSRFLEETPTANTRAVLQAVSGKDRHIRQALDLLHEEGYVTMETGGRGGQQWVSKMAFRAPEDDLDLSSAPVDNSTAAPAAHRGPTAAPVSGRGPNPTAAPAARGTRSGPGPGPRSDSSGPRSDDRPRPAAQDGDTVDRGPWPTTVIDPRPRPDQIDATTTADDIDYGPFT